MTGPNPMMLTLGYGARPQVDVLRLLGDYEIGYLVDVRSLPWSRWRPEFSQEAFAAALHENDVRYVFMGDALGGRPDDPSCYDETGRVDYIACRARPEFERAISRLHAAMGQGQRLALMCAEARPEDCHRTKLVAEALVDRGIDVRHLDEHDVIRAHSEIMARLHDGQLPLLAGSEDEKVTKSRGAYRPAASA